MPVSISGYNVISKLGEGGMGAVFKAEHELTGRHVAIKILPPKLAKDESYRKRFLREARAAAALNHKNITKVYDAGDQSGLYYMVMEYVEGESVANIIGATRPLRPEYALTVARGIAEGLGHAHEQGVIHRDIKPDNIMLNLERLVKITDMGLAKTADTSPDMQDITLAGTIIGTPKFMSPEQIMNPDCIDSRADLYSLGATLFYMLTGKPPFEGESPTEVMVKVCKESPRFPKNLPRPAVRLLRRLLAKEPEKRPRNAEKVVDMIDNAIEEMHLAKEQSRSAQKPAPDTAGKKPATKILLAASGAIIVLAIILIVVFGTGESNLEPADTSPDSLTEKPPEQPRTPVEISDSPVRKQHKEVLKYAKDNPGDFSGIIRKLESVLPEASADSALSAQIRRDILFWKDRWEDAARIEWEKALKEEEKLIAEGEYDGATKLWDSFAVKYKNLTVYADRAKKHAASLRETKILTAALGEIEEGLQAAQRVFAANEIEEAKNLLAKLTELRKKHKDLKPVIEKLSPVISRLREDVRSLEEKKHSDILFGATAPLIRNYDFEGAMEICGKASEDPRLASMKGQIEKDKKDVESLSHICKLAMENLRSSAGNDKAIYIRFHDGTYLPGIIELEGDVLLVKGTQTFVIELKTLHPDTIIIRSGLTEALKDNYMVSALLYAYSSFHDKAQQYLDAAMPALSGEEKTFYTTKFAYLKKNYPDPEKKPAVEKPGRLPYEAQLWFEIAKDLQIASRDKEAADALLNAVKLVPEDRLLVYGAASKLVWLNNSKKALEILKRAIAKNEDDAGLLRAEALAMHFSKKYRNALKRIDAVIKLEPDEQLGYLVKAGALNMLRKSKEARKAALKVWQLEDPSFAPMHMSDKEFPQQLAQAQQSIKSGEYDKAELIALSLLAARPENAAPYNLLGLVSTHMGEYKDAEDLFTGAVLLNPKFVKAFINLGYVNLRQGEADLALAAFETAKKLKPSREEKASLEQYMESAEQAIKTRDTTSKNSYDEGKKLCSQGNHTDAIRKFCAAVSLDNSSPFWWMGVCFHKLNLFQSAICEYDKAILIAPSVHDNYYNKGIALRMLRQFEDAIEALKKASELHKKKNGKEHYESWLGIADCYKNLSKTQEAADAQRKAQKLRPK